MTTQAPTSDIPIACDPYVFSKEERVKELALCVQVIQQWPTKRQELEDGFLFHYRGDEKRFLAIAQFAANEHRCCPWASFSVEIDPFTRDSPGAIRLRVTGGADAKAFLAEGFKFLEASVGNLDPSSIDDKVEERVTEELMTFQQETLGKKSGFLSKLKATCGC